MLLATTNQSGAGKDPSLGLALRQSELMTWNPRTLWRIAREVLAHGIRPSSLNAISAARHPKQLAVIDEFGELTYRELHARVLKLASALRDRFDVGPTKGVAIMCRNHRAFIEALLAGSTLGADVILLNTEFPGPQLAQILGHHQLGCVVHDSDFSAAFEQSGYAGARVVAGSGSLSVEDLISSGSGRVKASRKQGKIVVLTSGTTGVPKGAARTPSFRALSGPVITLLTKIPLRARNTILIASPLFHGFGLAYLILSLLLGATMVLRRRFDPTELLADIARHRVQALIAVPTLLKRLVDAAEGAPSGRDYTSLKAVLSSGAHLGGALCGGIMKTFGPCLYNLYGSSETGFGAIATPADLVEAPGTVGFPPIGTAIRLLDQAGQPTPAGQVGRVFLHTGLVFTGYVGGGNKEIVDGFMSTGDLGHMDLKGRLFIDGRADDMIVSGGENVFPLEVEEVLAGHPSVAEVAIIGVADEQFGQRLKAFVVSRPGQQITEDGLRGYLKERIARYKAPRDFVFLSQLPRNATGKVLKRDLAAN